ncbi:hypothetical protein Cni_G03782 [Canna indica]|uniref:Uncharacterized protein n=1 Tax=Canna indica TaxID=4628 RepID=A0AAQ3JVD5_9LILI|nr:hypothetical protein Cni_G03782 [Canna indica]
MLRRKPSRIEVKADDKEEMEEARRRRTSNPRPSPNPNPNPNPLQKYLDPSTLDAAAKAQRIGLHQA